MRLIINHCSFQKWQVEALQERSDTSQESSTEMEKSLLVRIKPAEGVDCASFILPELPLETSSFNDGSTGRRWIEKEFARARYRANVSVRAFQQSIKIEAALPPRASAQHLLSYAQLLSSQSPHQSSNMINPTTMIIHLEDSQAGVDFSRIDREFQCHSNWLLYRIKNGWLWCVLYSLDHITS